MTVEYKKAFKGIACLIVCLFGIEKAVFSTDSTSSAEEEPRQTATESEPKKSLFGRTMGKARKVTSSVKRKAEDIMDATQCAARCTSEKACLDNPSRSEKCAYECPESPCGIAAEKRANAEKPKKPGTTDVFTNRLMSGKEGVSGLKRTRGSSTKTGRDEPTWYKNQVDIGLNRKAMSCDDLKQRIYDLMMYSILAAKGVLSIKEQTYILGDKCPYEPMEDWIKRNPEKTLPFKNKLKEATKSKFSGEQIDEIVEQMHSQFPEAFARQEADREKVEKLIVADAFKTMNLPETATKGDVKKQYYKMSLKMHPDKGGNEEEFKNLGAAYNILELYFEKVYEER